METQNQKPTRKKTSEVGGLIFVGCLFLGMAAGYYFNHFLIGLFCGMGVGFIMMAVTMASLHQNKS